MEKSELVAIYFLGVFMIIAIIVTVLYLCYFIDCKNTNIIALIISSIFFFVFIFLILVINLDYFLWFVSENEDDEEVKKEVDTKFLANFLKYFYAYFNRIESIMNLVVLPFLINCFETGYYSICRIIVEPICRLVHKFLKLLKKTLTKVLLVLGLVIGIGVAILYYMFRKKYKLKEPLYYFDYISLASNIIALVSIYINVRYFMVQIFIDSKTEGSYHISNTPMFCCCCRECCQGSPTLSQKYYFFSIRLIIDKAKKFIKKIKGANEALNNVVKKYNNEANSKFHKFLLKKLQLINADLELYKYEEPQKVNDVIVHREYNINLNLKNPSRLNMKNQPNINIESETRNVNAETETNRVEIKTSKEKQEEEKKSQIVEVVKDEEKESEKILASHIRKYKKSTRKIKKLKKLCNDITEEFSINLNMQNGQNVTCKHKFWKSIKYILLYFSFAMVLITDIILPLSLYSINKDKSQTNTATYIPQTDTASASKDDDDSGSIITDIFIIIIGLVVLLIITSSYTIITLYSINRRGYISGDFLSGKKINDTISLMKTLKVVCSDSFPLVYLNYYFWKISLKQNLIFYETIYIPDYEIKYGIGIYMIAKVVVILFSIIFFKCGCLLQNDLAEYNKNIGDNNYNVYEDQMKFNAEIQNDQIYQLLIR